MRTFTKDLLKNVGYGLLTALVLYVGGLLLSYSRPYLPKLLAVAIQWVIVNGWQFITAVSSVTVAVLAILSYRSDKRRLAAQPAAPEPQVQQAARSVAESAEIFEALLSDMAEMSQNWTGALYTFLAHAQQVELQEQEYQRSAKRFCEDRMQEAVDWLGSSGEQMRLSLWGYSEANGGLIMVVSIGAFSQQALNHVFRPGEGLLGQVFVERRVWNLDDAQHEPHYVHLDAGGVPEYPGLLMIPLPRHDAPAYVLAVDRQRPDLFDDVKQNVAEALGHVLVIALTFGSKLRPEDAHPL